MAIQCYIDDSGSKGSGLGLYLLGVMGQAEVIADVADRWSLELFSRTPARIRYYKHDEARSLGGEFAFWRPEARNEKVRRLAKLIDRRDFMSLMSAVNLKHHREMERHVGQPIAGLKRHFGNQPLHVVFYGLILAIAKEAASRGISEPVEILVDRNEKYREDFESIYELGLPRLRELFGNVLPDGIRFRDDIEVVPIQWADMVAGTMREAGEGQERRLPVGLGSMGFSKHSQIVGETELIKIANLLTSARFGFATDA